MSPLELTTFLTAAANIIAKDRSVSELSILAAMFTQLGDTLATIAVLSDEHEDSEK